VRDGHTQKVADKVGWPVNWWPTFSDPMTSSPPAASRRGVGAGPRPLIKTHSSPAAFPTALSITFLPPFTFLHRPPSCLRLSASSTYFLRAPLTPPDRYDVASKRNSSAGPPALIRSTPGQHCLVGHPAVLRPLVIKLMKRLAFQQDAFSMHSLDFWFLGTSGPRPGPDELRHYLLEEAVVLVIISIVIDLMFFSPTCFTKH